MTKINALHERLHFHFGQVVYQNSITSHQERQIFEKRAKLFYWQKMWVRCSQQIPSKVHTKVQK